MEQLLKVWTALFAFLLLSDAASSAIDNASMYALNCNAVCSGVSHPGIVHYCRYRVRVALIDLGMPPAWFQQQAHDHLSAKQAQEHAGTDGDVSIAWYTIHVQHSNVIALWCMQSSVMRTCALFHPGRAKRYRQCKCDPKLLHCSAGSVLLLTNPASAGYVQNPISIYFCYSASGTLARCLAEVTNTPWNQRVAFAFDPAGSRVPKALHVSPMMDMLHDWSPLSLFSLGAL
jgi:Protein of unknown function (DUF1365)